MRRQPCVGDRRGRGGGCDVEPAGVEVGEHLAGGLLAQLDVDRRVRRAVVGENAGQLRRGAAGGAHADVAADAPGPVAHLVLDGRYVGKDPLGMVKEGRSGRRERDSVRVALEQRQTELTLQLADVLGERGLRHAQRLGGAGEVKLAGHGPEVLELS
jgi:hypothetical protein